MKLHHNWNYSDNLLVINFFYRHYKSVDYELLIKKIACEIGTTVSSVKLKISNMIYILSNGNYGHSNYSEDSRLALFEFLDKNRNVSLSHLLMILK